MPAIPHTEYSVRHRNEPTDPLAEADTALAISTLAHLTKHGPDDAGILSELAAHIHHQAVEAGAPQLAALTAQLHDHYLDHGVVHRQHEREQWAEILRQSADTLPDFDHAETRSLAHQLQVDHQPHILLRELWSPHNTVVFAQDHHDLDRLPGEFQFLQDYPTITDRVTESDIAGRHVLGDIPPDLERHAATVTRYNERANFKPPEEWTWEDYQNPSPVQRELLTHRVTAYTFQLNHLNTDDITFCTPEPEQFQHWQKVGLLDHAEQILLVTTDPDLPQRWAEAGVYDHRVQPMVVEPGIDPERWTKDIPRRAAVVYADVPTGAEHTVIQGKHVIGQPPLHLRHLAESTTSWPHDPHTGAFGQPVTTQAELILTTPVSGNGNDRF